RSSGRPHRLRSPCLDTPAPAASRRAWLDSCAKTAVRAAISLAEGFPLTTRNSGAEVAVSAESVTVEAVMSYLPLVERARRGQLASSLSMPLGTCGLERDIAVLFHRCRNNLAFQQAQSLNEMSAGGIRGDNRIHHAAFCRLVGTHELLFQRVLVLISSVRAVDSLGSLRGLRNGNLRGRPAIRQICA